MTTPLLSDAFRHHAWATDRLLAVCAELTPEQLTTAVPGTYGPILDTLRHLVGSDAFYLWVITDEKFERIDEDSMSIPELQAAAGTCAAAWEELLAGDIDPEADTVRRRGDWEYHSPLGLRLAQVVHHGTDHRSHVCTALTILGIEPPEIDLWAYGEATGRIREIGELPPA